nr:MAG TPA: Major capsid protein [Caudoviricetes sp.]
MKNMNMKERYWTMNLQVFAGDGGDDDPGDGGGDDDEPGDDDDDSDDDDEPEENEKKFSQKDVDDAVKKRLAREKRKWQRDHQKKAGKKPNGKVKTGEDSNKDDDVETQELRDKAAKADEMEMKWTCLEHDVDKSCVDDVLALARVHMAKDEDMDIEDAIDEVLKKYPQFKESSKEKDEEEDEGETKNRSWGQRQNGRRKKTSGVEAAFLKRNPGLKID